MKKIIFVIVMLFSLIGFGQEKQLSEPTKFIQKTSFIQINSNEINTAIFKSGLGESVIFSPSEIIDLKNKTTLKGLQVESRVVVGQQGPSYIFDKSTAWVGMDEIADLISWFELYVVPNINLDAGRYKSVSYIYNSKEISLTFEVKEDNQIFAVYLNNAYRKDKYFWTESRVDEIPNIVKALKYLQTK